MIFFLNLDGTLTRQDTGRIYQGSTAVPDIKVLSTVSSASGSLSVAFTLPNGLATIYYPLAIVGEENLENGFKVYLWGIAEDNEHIKADILGAITQEVGVVGVSVRQTNAITGEVVASYTASFNVEYSALPIPPTEVNTGDITRLLDLLNAYFAQNRDLIDGILPEVNARLDAQDEKIADVEDKVDALEEKVAEPVLVNITTDLETGVGTKYYSDGTTATFQIATDVTVVNRNDFLTEVSFATTSNWQLDNDGTCFIAFSPQTLNRTNNKCMAVIDKLDGNGVYQTGNGVFKGSDGTIILRGVTTPFDGKLLVLGGGSAGTKIWTGTTENGYESLDGALNGDYYLDTVSGNLYLLNNGIWTVLFSMRAEFPQREANTNGSVYVLTPNGVETPEFEALTIETTDHVTYSIKVGGKVAGTFEVPQEIYLEDVTYNPTTKTLSFIYNTESGEATIDIPLTDLEEVNNLLIVTTQSDFNDAVTSVNVGKVISYNSSLYIVESATENGTTTYRAKPYISLDEVNLFSTWQSTIEDLATENGDGITWTETSARVYAKNGVVSQPFRYEMRIPLIAGAGIEFEESADGQFVTIKSTGGGGSIVTGFNIGSDISELGINPDGKGIDVKYNDAEIEYDGGASYGNFPVEITMPFVAGENVTFEKDETNKVVKIDIPTANGDLVDNLAYTDLVDVPILIADLDTITPTANTYYKHNGADETIYIKGVIYFYDGTAFKAITGGSAGITDVQVNGTSVVTDGVANIPPASDTQAGVVTTGAQSFVGNKNFKGYTYFGSGSNRYTVRGEGSSGMQFYRTENINGTKYVFAEKSNLNNNVTLGAETSYISIRWGGVKTHLINFDTSNSNNGTTQSNLPAYSGTLMSAPSTWSTGTSGSATLPSAGLYEVKFTIYNEVRSVILNWDGTSNTDASVFLDNLQDPNSFVVLYATPVGILEVVETAFGSGGGGPASVSISYRKIGIA